MLSRKTDGIWDLVTPWNFAQVLSFCNVEKKKKQLLFDEASLASFCYMWKNTSLGD